MTETENNNLEHDMKKIISLLDSMKNALICINFELENLNLNLKQMKGGIENEEKPNNHR